MSNQSSPTPPPAPLDELTTQLLEVGAVLSQLVSGMVRFQAAGRSAPDSAPIPEVAHQLVCSSLDEIAKRHSRRDIRVAARIVEEATHAICENIFYVGPELN
jgi:hypothetical protein